VATTVARLQAVLGADTGQFDRAMSKSETRMHRAGKAAGVLGIALAGALAIGVKHAISDASDLHEQITKTDVVFGKNAKTVEKWATGLAKSFGLSDRAALEATTTYGNMLKPMGIAPRLVKKMSTGLTELAGDMASFNNADPSETLKAIQSGLANQVRPLRRFGVFLDQDRIKLEAVTSGLVHAQVDHAKLRLEQIKLTETTKAAGEAASKYGKDSEQYKKAVAEVAYEESKVQKLLEGKVPTLTSAQKAQAAYNIIMRDTKDTQGDFIRTSGGVANQQRILRAEMENLSATMGKDLLPVMVQVMSALTTMLEFLNKNSKLAKVLAIALGVLTVALLAAAAAQTLMNLAVLANPYVAAAVAIIALTTAMFILTQRSKTARIVIEALAVAIGLGLIVALVELIRNFHAVTTAVGNAWEKLKDVPAGAFSKALDVVHGAIRDINAAIHAMVRALEKVVDAFKWIIDNAKKIGGVFGAIGGAVGKVGGVVGGIGDGLGRVKQNVVTGGSGAAEGKRFGVGRQLWDEIGIGEALGLHVTSGFRPGARTKHGTLSDHALHAAVDMSDGTSGPSAAKANFFRAMIGRKEIRQAFYDPLGSVFNGVWSSYREGGHTDHVHVAEYDKGGFLRPGWNLAYNGLGRPEPVGGDVIIPVSVGGEHIATVVFDMLRRKARTYEKRNLRGAFGNI